MNKEAYHIGKLVVELMNKKKLVKVNVLDVHDLTPLADLFVIIVGSNVRQTQALADDIEDLLKENGYRDIQIEGYRSANWILVDCGEVIIHILEQEHAAFYGIERLWKDAPVLQYEE